MPVAVVVDETSKTLAEIVLRSERFSGQRHDGAASLNGFIYHIGTDVEVVAGPDVVAEYARCRNSG